VEETTRLAEKQVHPWIKAFWLWRN